MLRQYGDIAARAKIREEFLRRVPKPLLIRGEIRPTDIVPVIATSRRGNKACFPMQWGFNMEGRAMLPNARLETAGVNGKKETGAKYLIQPKGDHVTWLCGLYRFEDGLPHFVVLTRPPSEEISFIHDRMPLMLREKDVDEWISPDAKPDEIAYRAVTDLHYEKAVQTEKAPPPVPDLFLPSTFE